MEYREERGWNDRRSDWDRDDREPREEARAYRPRTRRDDEQPADEYEAREERPRPPRERNEESGSYRPRTLRRDSDIAEGDGDAAPERESYESPERDAAPRRDDDREDRPRREERYGDRDRGYGDRRGGYGDRDRGYGDRRGGYGDRDRGYGDRRGGYGDRDRGYGDRWGGYGDRDRGYGDRRGGYGDRDRGYGDRRGGYGDRDGGYGERRGGYGDRDRGYGDRRGGYGDRDRGYGDRRGGYGDRDRGYGDRRGGYGDRDRGYGDRRGGYGDRDRGYGDRRGGYGDRDRGYRRDGASRRMEERDERMARRFREGRQQQEQLTVFDPTQEMRLNRYIAHCGACSRRDADLMIERGEVTVNGEVVTTLGTRVIPAEAEVICRGKKLEPERKVYVLLNKPKDCFCTNDDEHAEGHTVLDLLGGAVSERIYPVGRLDRNSTGLLLLTNDGELTEQLTHPSHEKRKIYEVELDNPLRPEDMQRLLDGVEIEGEGTVKMDAVEYVRPESRAYVGVEIHTGQNRIVRRLFDALGYEVKKLDRVYYAGLTKKDLPRGEWRYLSDAEVIMLKTGRYE